MIYLEEEVKKKFLKNTFFFLYQMCLGIKVCVIEVFILTEVTISAAEAATEKALGRFYCALQSAAFSGLCSAIHHFYFFFNL